MAHAPVAVVPHPTRPTKGLRLRVLRRAEIDVETELPRGASRWGALAGPVDYSPEPELRLASIESPGAPRLQVSLRQPWDDRRSDGNVLWQMAATPDAGGADRKAGEPDPAAGGEDERIVSVSPFRIQLGAFRSAAEARERSTELARRHGDLLAGLHLAVLRANVKGTVYHRLRAGPFSAEAAAAQSCESFAARGVDCMVWARRGR